MYITTPNGNFEEGAAIATLFTATYQGEQRFFTYSLTYYVKNADGTSGKLI